MNRFQIVLKAAADVLHVPLFPAPCRNSQPCAVYRYYDTESDGTLARSRFEVRVIAGSAKEANAEIEALRRALISDGDSGILSDAGGMLLICASDDGSGAGRLRTGLYYAKAGFDIKGRA